MKFRCPSCNKQNDFKIPTTWDGDTFPCSCHFCDELFFAKIDNEMESLEIKPGKTRIKAPGTKVYIINKDHKLFLEQGTVRDLDHKHCRIEFSSLNSSLNGKKLWIPIDWLSSLPEELE
jgi:hypothetical protein